MTAIVQDERRRLAVDYAAGVEALLALAPPREAGLRARSTPRVGRLLVKSQALKNAASAALAGSTDPLDRAAAEVQLLAGAALDLAVASQLAGAPATRARDLAAPAVDVAGLRRLIEAPEAYLAGAVAVTRVRAVEDARQSMSAAAQSALDGISSAVVSTGGEVIEGLLLLDAALLKEALQLVGGQLAAKIGVDLKGLSKRIIDFVIAANEKIVAMLGIDAVAEAQKQLAQWLEELQAGTLFPRLVEQLYQTDAIEAEIMGWLAGYAGGEAVLLMGREEITLLAGRFAAKAKVADQLTAALALVKLAPPLATPYGRLGIAVAYLGLLAYLVGSGYDHVDSDRLQVLDWVEGVRGIAKRLLVTLPPA
ncbi:MAG: hypothetical protein FJ011_00075 [Chloroflexi bacterium]|nr:hypothetical protein [Chloroflexota bacterium]